MQIDCRGKGTLTCGNSFKSRFWARPYSKNILPIQKEEGREYIPRAAVGGHGSARGAASGKGLGSKSFSSDSAMAASGI